MVGDIEDSEEGTCKLWSGRVANRRISDGLAGGEAHVSKGFLIPFLSFNTR